MNKIRRQRGSVIVGVVIGFLLCFSAVTSVLLYKSVTENKNTNNSEEPKTAPSIVPVSAAPQPESKDGITWLETPKKIPQIPVYRGVKDLPANTYYDVENAEFYKVATLKDGSTLIDSLLSSGGPGGYYLIRFVETKENKYTCLSNYLDDWVKKDLETGVILQGITFEDRNIEGLSSPETINVDGKTFTGPIISSQMFSSLSNPKKLLDTNYGPIYELSGESNFGEGSGVLKRSLYLKLKDSTLVNYSLGKNNTSLQVYLDTENGIKSKEQFSQNIVSSCGSGFSNSVPIIREGSVLIASKERIGTVGEGSVIYQVKGASANLVKQIFKNYLVGRDYEGAPKSMTIEEVNGTVNHFLYKDLLGDWQLFVNQKYLSAAECGKPVIYLYPKEKTVVNVKVGAEVTKSEPLYPEGGWQVTAFPNGKLLQSGNEYGSLFWEGTGLGQYPEKGNTGFVVSQNVLVPTLVEQLSKLGLNQKESAEFLDFWVPKMPTTPYIRLTWFGTKDMNILAPLSVSPKPDTSIRIFLDFEGLSKPVSLVPQKLTSVERKGFTLVEWGGLLRKP